LNGNADLSRARAADLDSARVCRLEHLSERYREHNRIHCGDGFVWGGVQRIEPLLRAVGGPGLRILDLGCRDGALTRFYASQNHVVGLDVDREALSQAAKLGIETVWADAEEPFPFDDASFDVVVAAELLEHVREPGAVTAEAVRVLRPRGTLAGSVPHAYRLKNRLRFLAGRPIEENPMHLHMFSPSDIRPLLAELEEPRLELVVGRFVKLNPGLFANVIVFSAKKGPGGPTA
jgi:2-polyprenyl-3-methyl-5-hydroxy-6-metoxy-1,4-benzoquinol methylase